MQIKVKLDSRPIQRWERLFSKQTLLRAARVMGPNLVALTFAGVAPAQGTMDFSGAETLMGTFKTTALCTVPEAAEQRGYIVEGFAPTSRAAHQLRDAGISGHLARLPRAGQAAVPRAAPIHGR